MTTDIRIQWLGGSKTVRAVPIDGTAFAVHKVKGTWQITHVPSGKRVCHGKTYGHCKTVASMLARIEVPWDKEDPHIHGALSDRCLRLFEFLGAWR